MTQKAPYQLGTGLSGVVDRSGWPGGALDRNTAPAAECRSVSVFTVPHSEDVQTGDLWWCGAASWRVRGITTEDARQDHGSGSERARLRLTIDQAELTIAPAPRASGVRS